MPTRSVIAVVHDFGNYSGHDMNLVSQMVPYGHVLCGIDSRGHGRSPGLREYFDSWDDYRRDLRSFMR